MAKSEHTIKTADGTNIILYKHTAEGNAKANLVIVHGMAEHAQRYDEFADFLSKNGINVFAYDQRGHGKTAGSTDKLGFFSEKNGWQKVTEDLKSIVETAKSDYPDLPVFLLGHSMGSFVVRTYIADFNDEAIKGVFLSGTTGSAGLLGKIGILLTKIIMLFKKKNSPSPLMNTMSFGDFNKAFKPNRTDFDWLSRDNEKVDSYVNDPFCGTIFSIGFYNDMLNGLEYVNKPETINKIRKDLPVHFFSGEKDPVSDNSKKVKKVYQMFKDAGISDVSLKIYPDARHECLNETNRQEVFNDILNRLNSIISD